MQLHGSCARCRQLVRLPAPSRMDPVCPTCQPASPIAGSIEHTESLFLQAVMAGDLARADALGVTLDNTQRAAESHSALAAALAMAGHGWPVFPLKTGGSNPDRYKEPATKNGLHDATTDQGRIRRYWERHPNAGIGVATGHAFDAYDFDFRHEGVALKWADLRDTDIAVEALVTTPHGLHVYVVPSGLGNSARIGGHIGIDYRGRGGYVVAPPTWRPDGRYVWWSKPSPNILRQ